jgi:5'-deoxynucleotidase YfbR-like HD superfamily hydrolase
MDPSKVGLVGHTIALQSGQYFDFMNPQPEQILIEDIAKALANTCRYNGHCNRFYSVAEHSVHCAQLAIKEGRPNAVIYAALMHDAAEAYIGDMCKPLKNIMPEYQELEKVIELAVDTKFEVNRNCTNLVKTYDLQMLKAEKVALFPEDTEDWFGFEEVDTVVIDIECNDPDTAEEKFLELYKKYRPFSCTCSINECDFDKVCRKLGMCRYKHHEEVVNGKNRI